VKAAGMMAQEKFQKLSIQPARVGRKVVDLQPRLEVEVIADVAVLKIEVDQANRSLPRAFVAFQLRSDLDTQSRIPHATPARHECRYCSLAAPRSRRRAGAHPAPEHIGDFLGGIAGGDPISRAGLQKTLVVGRRDLVADENDETELVILN